MPRQRQSRNRRTQRRSRRQRGGDYAYTNAVYGWPQQAAPGSNQIAVINPNPIVGGRRKKKGGSVLSELAVPAVLLYANNTLGSRSKYGKNVRFNKNKTRRLRR